MRGSTCPRCGKMTLHEEGAIRACSNKNCSVIAAWEITPGKPGAGRGKKCQSCGKNMVREVYKGSSFKVKHCYGCKQTFIVQ
jgi:hypothetical protein